MNRSHFKLKQSALIAASVALIFADTSCWANPTGAQAVNGAVSFAQPNASTLNVTNSPGAIIHWQGFSIGASEVTRFIQQSASSAVLNRVVGGNISQIQGQLLSNGRVFLINPSGIVVGPGAVIDTAGFVGSTLNMLDADFLAGKLKFQGDADSGSIINQGWIRTSYGGQVILVAPQIENSGLIHTPGGELILAAGQKLSITSLDVEGVQFELQAPTDSVLNVGKLLADGGAVGVFAGTLKHSGDIRANALVYDEAGRIVLKAQNELQLVAGSTTSADGKTGGSVIVQASSGTALVAGSVSAQGSAGNGGNIALLGSAVAVVENGAVNASGSTGGGQILVGGDYQGANPSVQNATNTFVGASAGLRADATQSGDGGRVIVWSDDKAQFYGNLSARGGPEGGNGGFAEVSGKQNLIFAGTANLGAPQGGLGTLLLDPVDAFVFADGGLDATITDPNFIPDLFPSNVATVSPATLAGVVGNVALHATRYMRIMNDIDLTATPGQGLTATVGTYVAPALPDPLALNAPGTNPDQLGPVTIFNRMDIGANIMTMGGAVSLSAPEIQSFNAPAISTMGGPISLVATGAISRLSGTALELDAGTTGAVSAMAGTVSAFSELRLSNVGGISFLGTAPASINIGTITTAGPISLTSSGSSINTSSVMSGGGSVAMNAASSVNTGAITGGGGAVTLSGSNVNTGTIDTTGSVALTASAGSISSTVNNASSLTATSTAGFNQGVFISSTTDLNVNSISADCGGFTCPSVISLSTSAGSILATSASSQITAGDVTLSTGQLTSANAMEGGRIGTAALPLNVDARRNFTFSPNNDFRVVLTGTGPNRLNMQLGAAAAGDTWGQAVAGSLTGLGVTLSASADATTVTSSLAIDGNVTTRFNQLVFGSQDPSITLRAPNGSLVATSVIVPEGDTTLPVVGNPTETLNVSVSASNDLTLTTYTRQSTASSLAKLTDIFSNNGTVTLGTITGSKDVVRVNESTFNAGNVIVGSLSSAGNVSVKSNTGNVIVNFIDTASGGGTGTVGVTANAGAILAQSNGPASEIAAGGAISLTAPNIGTNGNPLDLVGPSIKLERPASSFTAGAFGSGAPINAVTSDLTINAVSLSFDTPVGGSTFNVNTGALALNKLAVTADPVFLGAGGQAQVQTEGGSKTYSFQSDGANFTFNPGAIPGTQFAGGSLSFTSSRGDISLGNINMGTGSLAITAREGSITGNALLDGAALTLTAGVDNNVSGTPVSIATGNIGGIIQPVTLTIKSGNNDFSKSRTGSVTAGTIEAGSATVKSFGAPITVGDVGAVTPGTVIDINASNANVVAGNLNASSSIKVSGNTVNVGTVLGSATTIDLAANNSSLLTLGGSITGGTGSKITLISTDTMADISFSTINASATGEVTIKSPQGITQSSPAGGITAEKVTLIGSGTATASTPTAFVASPTVPLDLFGTKNLAVDVTGKADLDANGSLFQSVSIIKGNTPLDAFNLNGMAAGQDVNIGGGSTGPFTVDVVSPGGSPLAFTFRTTQAGMGIQMSAPGIVTSGGALRLQSAGALDTSLGTISTGGGNVELLTSAGSTTLGAISSGGGNIGVNPASLVPTLSCSTLPCDITVGGALNAGAGKVELRTASGNIAGGGAITSTSPTSVVVTTQNGEIGTSGFLPVPLVITSPTVTLQATRGSTAMLNEGFVRAQLTDTTDLTLSGDFGFNVLSTNTGFTTLSVATKGTETGGLALTAPGQTYLFERANLDLFGIAMSAFRIATATGPATATFTASDGDLLIGRVGTTTITSPTLTLLAPAGTVRLQGDAGNPLSLDNPVQNLGFNPVTNGFGAQALQIKGNVTLGPSTSTQRLYATGDITAEATGGSILISAASQTVRSSGGIITFKGGAGANEQVTVSASSAQTIETVSGGGLTVEGVGNNSFAKVLYTGSGTQKIYVRNGTVSVKGGPTADAIATIDSDAAQDIGCPSGSTFFGCGNAITTLNILGGDGDRATARIHSDGLQQVRVTTTTKLDAGPGNASQALLDSVAGQNLISVGNMTLTGDIGPDSLARIFTPGNQNINFSSLTMTAGTGSGSFVKIDATTAGTTQSLFGGNVTLTAGGAGQSVEPFVAVPNASAIIEGHSQSFCVFSSCGAITLNGGAGAAGLTSDALLRNLSGDQIVNASSITLNGGHTQSTTGILNLGTGTQTVSGSNGITLRSDPNLAPAHADSFVLIQNPAATLQTITANFGGLTLINSGDGTVSVTSAGTQAVTSHFVDVTTSAGGAGDATLFATGNQRIHTTNETGPLFFGMRVAALGAGTASVESGASQLLEVTYPEVMQSSGLTGAMVIGDVNVAGTSRIKAVDQTVIAGSIIVQSGALGSISELKASGTQTVSTLTGGISVIGGSGDNSLAQIDPLTQTILSNGALNVQGGSGVNAIAQIVSASAQTIYATNGDFTLSGGSASGAAAFITNGGPVSILGTTGDVILTPGTAPGADALITVGPGGSGALFLACGGSCILPVVGPTPTAGALASGGVIVGSALPTGPLPISPVTSAALGAADAVNDATQSLLTLEEDQEDARLEAEPETVDTTEGTTQPTVPICT